MVAAFGSLSHGRYFAAVVEGADMSGVLTENRPLADLTWPCAGGPAEMFYFSPRIGRFGGVLGGA